MSYCMNTPVFLMKPLYMLINVKIDSILNKQRPDMIATFKH